MKKNEWIEELKVMVKDWTDEEKREVKKELIEILKVEKGEGRKEEVERVLREKGKVSVKEISEILGISAKNVSSQLVYLKKKGLKIGTNFEGKKYIEE